MPAKSEEAKKKAAEARRAYDKEHMAQLAVKLQKEDAEAYKEYCWRRQTTVSADLAGYILACIGKEKKPMSKSTNNTNPANTNPAAADGRRAVTLHLSKENLGGLAQVQQITKVSLDSLVDAIIAEWLGSREKKKCD